MIQEICRAESLKSLDRETLRTRVLSALSSPMTAREVGVAMGFDPQYARQAVAPRITELTRAKLIEAVGTRHDKISNKMTTVYRRI